MKFKIALLMIGIIPMFGITQSNWPIKVAIGNEATSVPFTEFFTTPIHPTIQVGTEYNYKNKPHSEIYQTFNLGYIYHKNLYQGVYLNSE